MYAYKAQKRRATFSFLKKKERRMEKKSSVDVIRRSIRAGRYYLFKKARSYS